MSATSTDYGSKENHKLVQSIAWKESADLKFWKKKLSASFLKEKMRLLKSAYELSIQKPFYFFYVTHLAEQELGRFVGSKHLGPNS